MSSTGKRQSPGLVFLVLITVLLVANGCTTKVAATTPEENITEESSTATVEFTKTPTTAPTPTATEAVCQEKEGIVERVMMHSEVLQADLYSLVYTPPCYEVDGNYPVLYLLHGQNMTDSFWYELGVTEIADTAIVNGQKPFIIVMPFEVRNFDPPGDSVFDQALIYDLLPWIDGHYATCTERSCRAIGGVSRGGGWAVHIVARNFDLFGALGAHSFGLMPADTWWITSHLSDHTLAEYPRIYIDHGDKDYLREGIEYFVTEVNYCKIPFEYHVYPGIHEKAYWQAHVIQYMNFYMEGWN